MSSIIPSSLICCNGTRLTCLTSSPEKAKRSIAIVLLLTIFLTITVIIHQHSLQRQSSDSNYPSAHIIKPNEPTDLSDESLNYGIIFDCGSSGSRVYIYYWPPHSGHKGELLDIHQVITTDGKPLSKKIAPGLSTYNKNTTNAAEYLRPLLDFATQHIPKHKHKLTPLYIMATAGMRLIDPQDAELIRNDIIHDVPGWYDFLFKPHHVEIITGQWEGTYAWISLNYMLGRFSHSESSGSIDVSSTQENTLSERQATVGVIDMGGGSMQIAYELEDKAALKDDTLMTTVNLGCDRHDTEHTYHVYVTTFLGYGANSAFFKHKQKLVETSQETTIPDPCFNRLYEETVQQNNNTYKLIGSGNVGSCMNLIRPLLDKNECKTEPCSINGVHQPIINSKTQFYGISEYWYSFYDVLNYKYYYNKQKLLSLAEEYCSSRWDAVLKRSKQNLYPHADFDRLKTECFKVSWVIEALHSGLNFPADFQGLLPVNEINSQEVQWSLGALVYKTRNYPQAAIDETNTERMLWSGEAFYITPYILALCILVVLISIYVYCRQLHRMNVLPSFKTVPSMKYFMVDEESQIDTLSQPQSYP